MPLPSICLVVGGIDYTYEAENITWSNIDGGGCEMASFDVESNKADNIFPGDRVFILDGTKTIWVGRVSEPAKMIKHGWHTSRKLGSANTRISCEGAGACNKDNQYSMIYVDQDLTRWQGPSYQRQLAAVTAGYSPGDSGQIAADPVSGSPVNALSFTGDWAASATPDAESWYDAGPLNSIGKAFFSANYGSWSDGTTVFSDILLSSDDHLTAFNDLGFFTASHAGAYINASGVQKRFATIHAQGSHGAAGGTANLLYAVYWTLAVYGNHSLPGRGPDPVGFYPSDIAGDAAYRAIQQGAWMKLGRIDPLSSYTVTHYVQYTPVTHDQVQGDMAKLAPAHCGVWPSSNIFDDTPEFTFRAYETVATAFCSLADCDEADVTERLADLYTTAIITYSDAAGTQYATEVSLPNEVLAHVGIAARTTNIDLGISSSAAAAVFASFALQVLFAQSRSGGTVDLPKRIRDRNGASFPSHWLRSGIDRLRVADLPVRSRLISASDTDSFRISRVESNLDTGSGEITTRVELDSGPNLIETLQARLEVAQILGGVGG